MEVSGHQVTVKQTSLLWVGLIAALLVVLVGCQPAAVSTVSNETEAVDMTETPVSPITPTLSAAITNENPTVEATAEPPDNGQTLTFWTIEQISPRATEASGDFINKSLRAFERSNPDIQVDLLVKKPSGKGGVLDFLRTARDVAPTVLPDVAILNATDLSQAYTEGLIQPLDGRLDRSIIQDLIPAARKMGTIDDQLLGVPLGLEMEHTVFNSLVFEEPPLTWTDVLTKDTKYLFPAKGVNGLVNDFTLAQYFSAGGELLNDEDLPTIDERILRDVLEFYQQALEKETIDPTILEAATTEELWPNYVDRQAGIAQITVKQYLSDRELLSNTSVAPLPVQNPIDSSILITHGWVFVLTTDATDLQHQAAALKLIEWFLSTSNNATWNDINKSIPSRDSSFQQLAGDDPYWGFLTEQLNMAQPQPAFNGYDRVGRIIQQAVEQVIRGEATPEEATATAIDALAQ
ncbi:MAG: extracellular solute-binding protein [Anaerolineae bacterium]|nr:extracellular solute-binding protein [Anaerolineae bacterium]